MKTLLYLVIYLFVYDLQIYIKSSIINQLNRQKLKLGQTVDYFLYLILFILILLIGSITLFLTIDNYIF